MIYRLVKEGQIDVHVCNSLIRNTYHYIAGNLSEEEIILQRKNKFLTIGRGRGFSSKSDISLGLSLKSNNINNFHLI